MGARIRYFTERIIHKSSSDADNMMSLSSEPDRTTAGTPSQCLVCGYYLVTSVASVRCPECGLLYDSSTRSWRPSKKSQVVFAATGGAIGCIPSAMIAWSAISRGVWNSRTRFFCILFATAITSLITSAILVWRQGNKYYLVTNREGLRFSAGRRRVALSWSDVKGCRHSFWTLVVIPRSESAFRISGVSKNDRCEICGQIRSWMDGSNGHLQP